MPSIILYEHFHYNQTQSGWSQKYAVATAELAGAANRTSSCKVEDGMWILYEFPHYNTGHLGAQVAVKTPGDYPTPGEIWLDNDTLHSLRPLPEEGICLFSEPHFCGEMVTVKEGQQSQNLGFQSRSVIVRSGEWHLWEDPSFSGDNCNVNIGQYPTLPSELHHTRVSSVQPAEIGNLLVVSRTTAQASSHPAAKNYELLDKPSVELIIDASGSMDTELDYDGNRVSRMYVAKDVLKNVVREDLPDGINVALRVFGERQCSTIRHQDLGEIDKDSLIDKIDSISGGGSTPIAASLAEVTEDLKTAEGSRLVVLVTDGEETCDGDVLKTIKELRASGLDVVINIVGFAISDAALKKRFTNWAEAGAGEYYDATKSAELKTMMKQALSIPYTVYRNYAQKGKGFVDGDAVELDPNTAYAIQLDTNGEFITDVTISSGKTTQVSVIRW